MRVVELGAYISVADGVGMTDEVAAEIALELSATRTRVSRIAIDGSTEG